MSFLSLGLAIAAAALGWAVRHYGVAGATGLPPALAAAVKENPALLAVIDGFLQVQQHDEAHATLASLVTRRASGAAPAPVPPVLVPAPAPSPK